MVDPTARFQAAPTRLGRMFLVSSAVGVLAGLAARLMESGLQFSLPYLAGGIASPAQAATLQFDARLILFPAIGGLISGYVTHRWCRPDAPHGTAALIDAFHHRAGDLPLRDAAILAALAVVVIAMGGSVGKETPIAVLGAAIGSVVAGRLGLPPRERRLFLLAGCGAGVGAIFQCPLGGALFAVTVLYHEPDIESDALMPCIIASVIGYSTFMAFGGFGHRLLRGVDRLTFASPIELPAYALLALLCAATTALFHLCLRLMRGLPWRKWMPEWVGPGAAGLAVGVVACAYPQVMDAGYGFVQNSLDRAFLGSDPDWFGWFKLFALISIAKCAATSFMMGTHTAGGLFGPVVFIGGTVGAATGALLQVLFPGAFPENLREALIPVGMAGMLSSSLRVPLAAMVMVMEMTGSYGLIVPLMLTSVLAYVLGRRWGVYGEQVGGLEHSPAHAGDPVVSLLEAWTVADLMDRNWPHVTAQTTPLPELVSRLTSGTRPTFAVVNERQLVGVISTGDLTRAAATAGANPFILVDDVMTPSPVTLHAEQDLYSALPAFREGHYEVLPVTDAGDGAFLGMLRRSSIHAAVRKRLEERRQQVLREHSGVLLLDQDGQLEALLSDLLPQRKGTVTRMPAPAEAIGKSLRDAEFRRRWGEVIAIQTEKGEYLSPPDPVRQLEATDVLLLVPRRPAAGGDRP